jgi:hypothetical protein
VAVEQMLERRDSGTFGVAALQRLPKLLRIAQQNEAFRGRRYRQNVGKSQLARLIHEEHVHRLKELLAGP